MLTKLDYHPVTGQRIQCPATNKFPYVRELVDWLLTIRDVPSAADADALVDRLNGIILPPESRVFVRR